MSTEIHKKAMLVNLTLSTWTARKYDKVVTAEVHAQHGADHEAGLYTKRLLGKNATEYKELMKISQETRNWHYEQTLPWSDQGFRLLPTANYMQYSEGLRERQNKFADAKRKFVETYPTLMERAKNVLGDMYNEADYPAPMTVEHKFSIEANFTPLPVRGDLRCELPGDVLSTIENGIEARVGEAVQEAVQDAWGRLYSTVEKVHERLADPDNIFRDSLIENAKEICEVMERLNVTEDPELENMTKRVRDNLTTYFPVDLRTNDQVRSKVAKEAEDIMNAMKDFYHV